MSYLVGSSKDRFSLLTVYTSRVMRKPGFCICENKDADQLRGNPEPDMRLCFCYTDSTIPLLPKYEISSLSSSCVVVQPGLCGTWSETPKTGFLTTRLIRYRLVWTSTYKSIHYLHKESYCPMIRIECTAQSLIRLCRYPG